MNAIAANNKVAVRSSHGVGKSAALAWVILWWLYTRYPAKVACTAPTAHQLKDVLWAELARWHRQMQPTDLRQQFEMTSERLMLKDAKNESFAVARASNPDNPETFQGYHSPHMLFVCDEASGVADIIYEVAQGAMSTEGAKTVMTGNPTRTSGYFYDAFHKARAHWHCIRVSHEDSELVTDQYVQQMADVYGPDSNVFRVRCLGEFPRQEDDVIIPLYLPESAIDRDVEPIPGIKPVWGLDVARYGDDRTALAKRASNVMLEPVIHWHGNDLMETVGRVMEMYVRAREDGCEPAYIMVDSIGIGAGVVDRLKELNVPVRGVNVGETAMLPNFSRLRSELWWRAREWFEGLDVKIPPDDALISELTQVKYKTLSTGKLEAEPKDKYKERVGRSPDLADAFLLTFAVGVQRKPDSPKMDRYRRRMAPKPGNWKTF